jgi:hypothetical protein
VNVVGSIVKVLVTLVLSKLSGITGLPDQWNQAIATILVVLVLFCSVRLFKKFISRCKYCKAARDLSPWFDYRKVKSSQELFIPTKFRNNSPTREDEPSISNKFIAKNPLIPHWQDVPLTFQ